VPQHSVQAKQSVEPRPKDAHELLAAQISSVVRRSAQSPSGRDRWDTRIRDSRTICGRMEHAKCGRSQRMVADVVRVPQRG